MRDVTGSLDQWESAFIHCSARRSVQSIPNSKTFRIFFPSLVLHIIHTILSTVFVVLANIRTPSPSLSLKKYCQIARKNSLQTIFFHLRNSSKISQLPATCVYETTEFEEAPQWVQKLGCMKFRELKNCQLCMQTFKLTCMALLIMANN